MQIALLLAFKNQIYLFGLFRNANKTKNRLKFKTDLSIDVLVLNSDQITMVILGWLVQLLEPSFGYFGCMFCNITH